MSELRPFVRDFAQFPAIISLLSIPMQSTLHCNMSDKTRAQPVVIKLLLFGVNKVESGTSTAITKILLFLLILIARLVKPIQIRLFAVPSKMANPDYFSDILAKLLHPFPHSNPHKNVKL